MGTPEGPKLVPGLMQQWPLNVYKILDHAAKWHPEQEIVCKTVEGPIVISTYADLHRRARLCSLALSTILNVKQGSMVATMAWNGTRHMESWYGIMGLGAITHTLNPRLSDRDLVYIMNNAQDEVVLADTTFIPQLERILPQVPSIKAVVLLTDRQHMPSVHALQLPVMCYEEMLDGQVCRLPGFTWTPVPEDTACGLCYTSGTTGNPKGVLYSHRANFLHALMLVQPDSVPLGSSTCCLAIVPMFHANAWGMVFAAPLVGARLVLPGPHLDGPSIHHLMESFGVTVSAAVPTVWLNLLAHMDKHGLRFNTLKYAAIGGAAAPCSLIEAFEKKYGVEVRHLWGMTELTPLGTVGGLKGPLQGLTLDEIVGVKAKQGRAHVLCEMRIADDQGRELPHDGKTVGHLQVRGPHVVHTYFKLPHPAVDSDGWFATGDVAAIDPWGHVQITDRSKDVIKSGGEWISSLDIENQAMSHPAVGEAAVVAVADVTWGERPLLVVVLKPGHEDPGQREAIKEDIIKFLTPRLAKFALPDEVVAVEEIPHTATGKVSKLMLRELFKGHVMKPHRCAPTTTTAPAPPSSSSAQPPPAASAALHGAEPAAAAASAAGAIAPAPEPSMVGASQVHYHHSRL